MGLTLLVQGVGIGLAVAAPLPPAGVARVIAGVALGSSRWWLALTTGVAVLRDRCPEDIVRKADRACGLLVIAAGAVVAASPWIH